jgi:GH18 family chitinase
MGHKPGLFFYLLCGIVFVSACSSSQEPLRPPSGYRVIGYAPEWVGLSGLSERTDFNLFTHLNISFGNPDADGNFEPLPGELLYITRAHASGVKVFYSLGGGTTALESDIRDRWLYFMEPSRRDQFIENIVGYVIDAGYDGIDLDLEGEAITALYSPFVLALYGKLQDSVTASGQIPELSAALPAWEIDPDITPEALGCFDWINIMAYDLTGPWDPTTPGPHSPYSYAGQGLALFRMAGLGPERMVLGLPLYGYGFGAGFPDEYYPFKEIVTLDSDAWRVDNLSSPQGGVLHYNGADTIRQKTRLAANEGSGVMFWQIDDDAPGNLSLIRCAVKTLKEP